MTYTENRPLLELWPQLRTKLAFAKLAELPTPVTPLSQLAGALGRQDAQLWEKRDDLTSPLYGGNKVRTLEVLLARALRAGSQRVFATGAYGSNHAVATAFHAPRVGLQVGAALYPQPPYPSAKENLRVLLAQSPRPQVLPLPHWSALPWGMLRLRLGAERARITVMDPGGAVPWGALGYVSAGLELAMQVMAGALPCPRRVVLPVGSNCTSAGLLLGFALAARRQLGFTPERLPTLLAVRVTPWPVTSRYRILKLARETSSLLHQLSGDRRTLFSAAELGRQLQLDRDQIGRGYGFASTAGQHAVALWNRHVGHPLETTYSGKAAAAFIDHARHSQGPLLFWATKSSAPLPAVEDHTIAWAPRPMRRWLRH